MTLWCTLSGSSLSWAGTIGLQLRASTSASEDLLVIAVELTNIGDEAAYEINPVIWIEGTPQRFPGSRKLNPQRERKMTYTSVEHPFQQPGLYHLPLHIGYRDTLGSHFKLAYLLNLVRENRTESGLAWKVGKVLLPTDEVVEITLTNLDQQAKLVHLTQITSMSIQFDLPASPVLLAANEEKSWIVKVTHDTLSANTYPNYVIASYSLDETHFSEYVAVETEVISVSDIGSEIFTSKNMTWALLMLIVIALVGGYGPGVFYRLWQKRF